MAAKGLTRNITRKQALSYDRTTPNARGVTALAEINGPGAYQQRYRQTREILQNPGGRSMAYTVRQRSAMKKMSPARRAAFRKMLARSPDISQIRPGKKRRKNPTHVAANKPRRKKRKSYRKNQPPGFMAQMPGAKPGRVLKREYVASMVRRGHSQKLAESYWKRRGLRPGQKPKKRKGRSYGGGIKPLKARIGPKSRYTYQRRTKKGHVRHIPEWSLLRYKSAAAMRKAQRSPDSKVRSRLAARRASLLDRRVKAADKTRNRIMAGKGIFAPNEGDTVLSFEEWKKMRRNAAKKKTRKKGKLTKAERRKAALKGARTRKRRAATKRRKPRKKVTRRKGKPSKAQRRAAALKGARTRKRRAARKPRKKVRRKRRTRTVTVGRTGHKVRISYAANRHTGYAPNRRKKRKKRRSYRRNVGGAAWKTEMMNALKLGLIVTGGYIAHRALTKVLEDQALSKIKALQTGQGLKFRGLISGAIVAAIGVPLVVRIMPMEAAAAGAGIAASFLHSAIIGALSAAKQEKAIPYLSAYPDAEGRAYGAYYEFSPHEIFSGTGEYYETPTAGYGEYFETPAAGFGQLTAGQITQAAAGYGQNPHLAQAAAGYGQNPMLTQAAAGYGQAVLTQAAAGTGEYIAYGVHGVGEYDEVPTSPQPIVVDEGVYPNLHSAEQALNVAEAAAGVGAVDVPVQQTVNPMVIADPIGDEPGGSRAGILAGGDGIFG